MPRVLETYRKDLSSYRGMKACLLGYRKLLVLITNESAPIVFISFFNLSWKKKTP
ncbi:MAG: hypothetical protein KUG64_09660 [Cycloclasticus sp.]|nr:hypothetical protein [Cycloclasticus sp.]